MGSVKNLNLNIDGLYLYFKNVFNSNFAFWYYYYFYFFILKIIDYIIIDSILLKFCKKKFINFFLQKMFISKKNFFLGTSHLFKFHNWFILNLFIYKKIKITKNYKLNFFINFKKIFFKKKMNYKYLINKMDENFQLKNNSIYKFFIEKRLEYNFKYNKIYFSYTIFLLNKFVLKGFYNYNKFFNKLYLFSIYFLDLNFMCKGWHYLFFSLVKEYYRWINNGFFYDIKFLKYYKLLILKNYLNINDSALVNNYLFVEYINLLWKLQWTSEWFELKKKRLFFLKKKNRKIKLKFDKFSIFEELIYVRMKLLKKKNKSNVKGNYVALGFEPGYGLNFLK